MFSYESVTLEFKSGFYKQCLGGQKILLWRIFLLGGVSLRRNGFDHLNLFQSENVHFLNIEN